MLDNFKEENGEGNVTTFAYADDLMLVVEAETIERLQDKSNLVLDAVVSWGQTKGLVFNPNKTQCLLRKSSCRVHPEPPAIRMHNTNLILTNELIYLGVLLHSSGSWIPHLNYAKEKADKKLSTCARIAGRTWGINRRVREDLYRTIFLPTLLYAAPAWTPSLTKMVTGCKAMISAQRPALIWCTSAFRTTSRASNLEKSRSRNFEKFREISIPILDD